MVVLLVVLTFVVLVALDHFVLSKRYPELTAKEPARPNLLALSAAWQPVPAGVFLQPTYTWGRIGETGEVYLGLHPMLLGLVGAPWDLALRGQGEHVAKGEPLVRIGRGGRHLTVRSPIAGRVDKVNHQAISESLWRGAEGHDGSWLYRLLPERLADEAATWLAGEAAAEWTRRRYDDLRAYLHGAVTDRHLGVVMADGGELPVGILGEMDEGVWAGLEARFLAPGGETTRSADRLGPEGRR